MNAEPIHNPDNYRELSKPFATEAEADAAVEGFWKELYELRNKYKIPDIYLILRMGVVGADGVEGMCHSTMQAGSPSYAESMTAWAFGCEQAKREEIIAKLVHQGVKSKGRKN